MSNFIQFVGQNMAQWWTFLCNTTIPGTSFSFAALFIFLLVFNVGIMIFKIIMSGNTQGGTKDVGNKLRGK